MRKNLAAPQAQKNSKKHTSSGSTEAPSGDNFFYCFSENVRYCLVRGFFREKNVIFERVNGESHG